MDEFKHFKYSDPGDKYDKLKWDFNESGLKNIKHSDGYNYLVNDPKNVIRLAKIREKVNKMANYIHNNYNQFNPEAINGLRLFVSLHGELPTQNDIPNEFRHHWIQSGGKTSKVMYSELPKGTMFLGLNKPKSRHVNTNAPKIGKDKQLRSRWRHIFFNLNRNDRELKDLVIHELAHSAANHCRWRDDDHNSDFIMYENSLKRAWEKLTKGVFRTINNH